MVKAAITAPHLVDELEALGAPRSSIRQLGSPSPANINYLDLMRGVSVAWDANRRILPSAVVEFERKPVLYVVDISSLAESVDQHRQDVAALRSKLASRGDAAWLAVRAPGQITIYSLGLRGKLPEGVTIEYKPGEQTTLIQDLALKGWGALRPVNDRSQQATGKAFHDVLLQLVTDANAQLLASPALSGREADVLSLVGRALFARFLIDRGFMTQATFPAMKGEFASCFDTPSQAALTCRWLDQTFNGELLELSNHDYRGFFSEITSVDPEVLEPLSRILYHAPGGQLSIKEAWGGIDFAHVPAGLLSEVYEQFAHAHGPKLDDDKKTKLAKVESIHYTPRAIAEFMLDQAFDAIRTCPKRNARVLDPASGGGVFLVLAYRRIVAAEWEACGRPNRKRLREILYEQIRGFDINESALKLAALSLYLTALELDPEIENLKNIAFDPMIGRVLTLARESDEPHTDPFVLGSLGPMIGAEHNKRYDLLIGNPPWTSWKGLRSKKLAKASSEIVQRVADAIHENVTQAPALRTLLKSYKNPDSRPDLAFVWRAMEWAKDDGVIAFALHARLLFNRDGLGAAARHALFSALKVTGILNGTALRLAPGVWPHVEAQWCMLFARNLIPKPGDAFYLISPQVEDSLNNRGIMRVDYASAEPIEFGVLAQNPGLLKILFRGTELDADLMGRLKRRNLKSLDQYWQAAGLASGEGYKVGGANRVKVPEMQGWPNLSKPRASNKPLGFALDVSKLEPFDKSLLERKRSPKIYAAPLLILPVSIQYERDNGVGLISDKRVAYSESFFGYSAAGFKAGDPEDLARYLHVLTASTLFMYHALMTSSQFGVERDTLQKEDVDSFPILSFESLSGDQLKVIRDVSAKIEQGLCPWKEADAFVAGLYGLSAADQRVMADTLAVSLTYSDRVDLAQAPPTSTEVRDFADELQERLRRHLNLVATPICVTPRKERDGAWTFLDVTCGETKPPAWLHDWLIALGEQNGSTRIIAETQACHLGIGILSQYRYWTSSRARLCARTIISDHSDHLLGDGGAG